MKIQDLGFCSEKIQKTNSLIRCSVHQNFVSTVIEYQLVKARENDMPPHLFWAFFARDFLSFYQFNIWLFFSSSLL